MWLPLGGIVEHSTFIIFAPNVIKYSECGRFFKGV